jgi:hypothetical protein
MMDGATIAVSKGYALAFFAFDIGYEVALDQARRLLTSAPVQPLSRKKQSPIHLQYTTPPEVVQWGQTPLELAGQAGTIQITLYDFGAVSIAYRWSLPEATSLAQLAKLSDDLYERDLDEDARTQLRLFFEKIRPAIKRPEISSLIEDYYVFVIECLDKPCKAQTLLAEHGSELAQVLRLDTRELSEAQRHEALSQYISYYQNDLVLIDWNAALIYDQDYTDVLNLFELLNVELLEARYTDAQLDRTFDNYERVRNQRKEWPLPFRIPYRRDIEALAELRIESSLLSERVDNALKLIGDDYLARVYATASHRFSLHEWDAAISRKLALAAELYQVLTDRVSTAQGQTLELIVIVLIVIEILLAIIQLH